jgi:hypothetical protein
VDQDEVAATGQFLGGGPAAVELVPDHAEGGVEGPAVRSVGELVQPEPLHPAVAVQEHRGRQPFGSVEGSQQPAAHAGPEPGVPGQFPPGQVTADPLGLDADVGRGDAGDPRDPEHRVQPPADLRRRRCVVAEQRPGVLEDLHQPVEGSQTISGGHVDPAPSQVGKALARTVVGGLPGQQATLRR